MFIPNIGIYKISNKTTGKFYIGSSVNIKSRFYAHKNLLRRNKHDNSYLQASWNKYGEADFIFETILCCFKEDLKEFEQYYLDQYIPFNKNNCYNLQKYALDNNLVSIKTIKGIEGSKRKGRTWSEESKKKMSETMKGRCNCTPDHFKKLSILFKNRKYSKETLNNMKKAKESYFKLYDLVSNTIIEGNGLKDFAIFRGFRQEALQKVYKGKSICHGYFMTCNVDSLKEVLQNQRRLKFLKKYDEKYSLFNKIKEFIEIHNDNSC